MQGGKPCKENRVQGGESCKERWVVERGSCKKYKNKGGSKARKLSQEIILRIWKEISVIY